MPLSVAYCQYFDKSDFGLIWPYINSSIEKMDILSHNTQKEANDKQEVDVKNGNTQLF